MLPGHAAVPSPPMECLHPLLLPLEIILHTGASVAQALVYHYSKSRVQDQPWKKNRLFPGANRQPCKLQRLDSMLRTILPI
ncbi:hypothetical protein Holit_01217 [Hollandina sp. SP2]